VKAFLDVLGLPVTLNHRLVRGLDYYTRTVFEIGPTGETAAQATIGGGGRYDKLIEQLGGKPTAGIGFATGIERLVLNLKHQGVVIPPAESPGVFVAYLGADAKKEAVRLASDLRAAGITVVGGLGDRSLKAQLKQANTSNARYAAIIGDEEASSQAVILRDMVEGAQETVPVERLVEALNGKRTLAHPKVDR
jgi:histidyl-tRNA synthetase